MVVGIDYPETLVDYNSNEEYKIMKNWNIKKYVKDIRKAVRFSQKKTAIDQYGITGHSFGGILSLAYASNFQHDINLQSIVVLENGQFDPETEPDKVERAINDSNALRQDIKNGYVNGIWDEYLS
ncbi:MAG: alpha/beta hydrolase [Methanosarcinales archaeon]|nr:alpha/beta hydrolase [Methanosarcinales archaeon]